MRTVLVIDDEPGILTPVKSILDRAGYATITASSPRDGLEKARALHREIDLIVTDITMPGLNGLTLIQPVFDKLGVMGVLLMSGNAKVSSRLPVLRKPFLMQELLNRVATVLEAPLPSDRCDGA